MKDIVRIKNGYKYTENGWTRINVKGTPYEIGYAHGYLMSKELVALKLPHQKSTKKVPKITC